MRYQILTFYFSLIVLVPTCFAQFSLDESIKAEADSLVAVAESLIEDGQYGEGVEHFNRAIELYTSIQNFSGLAYALNQLGELYYDFNKLTEALAYWQEAQNHYHEIGDTANEARILKKIGWVHDDMSNYTSALESYQLSLVLSREIADRKLESQNLSNLGVAYIHLDEYEMALDFLNQSLIIRRDQKDRNGEALVLINIGIAQRELGHYDAAIDAFDLAIEISHETGHAQHECRALTSLGLVYKNMTNYSKALANYSQSLEIHQEIGDRKGEAITRHNIGMVYDYLFNHEKALYYYVESLQISREIGDITGVARTLVNIGIVYLIMGDYEKALEYLHEALQIKQKLGDRQGEGLVQANIGLVYYDQKRYNEAENSLHASLSICEETGDLEGKCIAQANLGRVYTEQKNFGDAADFIKEAMESARDLDSPWTSHLVHDVYGNYYLQLDDFDRAVDHLSKAIKIIEGVRGRLEVSDQIRSFSAGIFKTYEQIVSILINQNRQREAYEYIQRNRARAFLNLMAQGSKKEALPEEEDVLGIPEVQRTLSDTTTLVEYYMTDDRLFIWTIDENVHSLTQVDISREDIRDQVLGFNSALVEQGAVDTRARRLYRDLIQPIEHRLTNEQIIIVPHGVLHYLPFQALMNEQNEYMISRYTISYLPVASLLKYGRVEKETGQRSLLALGNPRLDQSGYADLQYAEAEVKAVAQLFDERQVFLSEKATEDKFQELAPEFRILHLACHSELDAAAPLYSGLLLAPGPLQDGELDVHEIFNLHFNAELVVLSACQTARGFLTNGDDLVSLSRAFISAGANAVISSLWSVSDESTAYLMSRFYYHLGNSTKARALRDAQRETIEKYGKPYSWAPFILIGDPN